MLMIPIVPDPVVKLSDVEPVTVPPDWEMPPAPAPVTLTTVPLKFAPKAMPPLVVEIVFVLVAATTPVTFI